MTRTVDVFPGGPAIVTAPDSPVAALEGAWTLQHAGIAAHALGASTMPTAGPLHFDLSRLTALDTVGAFLLARRIEEVAAKGIEVSIEGASAEHAALLELVRNRLQGGVDVPSQPRLSGLAALGMVVVRHVRDGVALVDFVGEVAISLLRTVAQPKRFRFRAAVAAVHRAGWDALPLVGLLSFLFGLVVAYQSALQLEKFGATLLVADLVGFSMLRELSPMLVAILVAARSGSAYAAEIGTMRVTEEVDALTTLGMRPLEILVVPRAVALALTVPLLTVYADALGVLGGMVTARAHLDIAFESFLDRLNEVMRVSSFLFGVGKAMIFGLVVAIVGAYQGFSATAAADSVGRRTTASVVQAIFLIVVLDAAFSVAFSLWRL